MTSSACCVAADEPATVAASAAVQVRPAALVDAPGIASVHLRSWQATYPGLLPDTEIERHTVANRLTHWQRMLLAPAAQANIWVAVRADVVIGFASGGAFRVESPGAQGHTDAPAEGEGVGKGEGAGAGEGAAQVDGELNALYLLPDAQGQGIGRQLFDASARALQAAGFPGLRCWVLEGNPAIGFYEHLGGVRVATKSYAALGATVPQHCYRFALTQPRSSL